MVDIFHSSFSVIEIRHERDKGQMGKRNKMNENWDKEGKEIKVKHRQAKWKEE
jgi:hypothetical protein